MPSLTLKHKYFAANLAVLWLAVLCYRTNHYYLNFLSERTQEIVLGLAVGYTVAGLLYYWLAKQANPTHAYTAIVAAGRWMQSVRRHWSGLRRGVSVPFEVVSGAEKTSLLFLLLKFLYLPMMLEFMVANWSLLAGRWWSFSDVGSLPRLVAFNNFVFPCLIDMFFITECALYAFGYAVESGRLKNVVKSVDPTFLGWAAALACYPPFNGFVNNYVLWYTSDDPNFTNAWLSLVAKIAVLASFAIYLWGAISLGAKCSNLTNRGIVTTGAFAYVRHPAYAAKNLAWWIGILPVLSLPAVLSMAFWSFVYFLRAVTEERHLMNDPDYRAYCQKVPYRFIPGLF
jgi:protein-S-isoprenylcysteine O-methyltransferase Ste14